MVVRAGTGRTRRRRGHKVEELTPPLPGQRADVSVHTLAPGAATGAADDPPVHEPGSRETAVVVEGTAELFIDGQRHELDGGRQRHLRRRPAAPFREQLRDRCPADRGGRRRAEARLGGPMAKNLFEKIWEAHEVDGDLIYIDLHLVHEVTSPQAFDGLRLAERRPAPPGQDPGDRRSQRPHRRHAHRAADRGRALAQAGRGAGEQLRGVRHPALLAGLGAPRHRPRDRPGAGRHPAGHDDRLRRLPHLDPWRLRRARLRHRHLGGRARAGDPVPGPAQAEDDADQLLGRARLRRHRQGPDPGDDRPARRRRHAGIRGRVRGRGDPRRSRWRTG